MKLASWRAWFLAGKSDVRVDLTLKSTAENSTDEIEITVWLEAQADETCEQFRERALAKAKQLLEAGVDS